jgi:hypothetical protein
MDTRSCVRFVLASAFTTFHALGLPAPAVAQSLGTFRWQQQPYCNVITVNVVQAGQVYQVDGFDDQCGASTRAAVAGLAFPNPNGTIGFGLTVVTSPGGTPVHIDATISLSTLSGTWRDSSGGTGNWTFTGGGGVGGSPRPVPRASFPGGLSAGGTTLANVGTPAVASDAANKGYVDAGDTADRTYADAGDAAVRTFAKQLFATTVNFSAYGANRTSNISDGATGCLDFNPSGQVQMDLPLPIGAVPTTVTVKYRDSSSGSMSIGLRVYTMQEGAARTDDAAANVLSSSNGPVQGIRVQAIAVSSPQPVTAARGYYLNVSGSAFDALPLGFCGAQVTYTIP